MSYVYSLLNPLLDALFNPNEGAAASHTNTKHLSSIRRTLVNNWQTYSILVPRTSALKWNVDRDSGLPLTDLCATEEFLASHIIHTPTSQNRPGKRAKYFTTLNGRTVVIKDGYVYTQKGFKSFVRASVLSEQLFYPASPIMPLDVQFVVYELDVALVGVPVPSKEVSATVSSRYDLVPTSDYYQSRIKSNVAGDQQSPPPEPDERNLDYSKLRKRSLESLLSAYPALSRQVLNPLLIHIDAFDCNQVKSDSELLSFYDQFYDTALQIFQDCDPNLLSRLGNENNLTGEDLADIVAQFVETKVSWKLGRRVVELNTEPDAELLTAMESMSSVDLEQVLLPQEVSVTQAVQLGHQLWNATKELSKMSNFSSADDKIDVLLRSIDILSATDVLGSKRRNNTLVSTKDFSDADLTINADLLLPLIMVMLVRVCPKHFISELYYIEKFTYRDTENGPLGWALVTFHGVVSQIKKDALKYSSLSLVNKNVWQSIREGTFTDADLNFSSSKLFGALDDKSSLSVLRSRTPTGDTCLSLAITSRQPELLELLLSSKDVYTTDYVVNDASWDTSKSLLMSAVETGDKQLVNILLDWMRTHLTEDEQSRYLRKTDCWNRQIAHYFFHCPWLIEVFGPLVDWEFKDLNGQTPLFALCRCYDHPQYAELLRLGFKAWDENVRPTKLPSLLDHVDSRGNTILHVLNDEYALKLALQYDVNVNWANDRNRTPFMVYSKFSRIEPLQLLAKDARTDLDRTDHRGCNALDFANEPATVEALENIYLSREQTPIDRDVLVTRALVQNGELLFVVKSGNPKDPTTFQTVKRSFSDFTFLQKWLAYENPNSWLLSLSMPRDPFSVSMQVFRQVLRELCIKLTAFLRVLIQHPTFADHELVWEFLMVQDMPQQQSVDRCRGKVASRREALSGEITVYSTTELEVVQVFLEHAMTQTKQLSLNMHNVSRCAMKLRNKSVDYCQALHHFGSRLSVTSDFKSAYHTCFVPEFRMAFEYVGRHRLESLACDLLECYATTEAVVLALSKPLNLISRLKDEDLTLDKLNAQLEKVTAKSTWQLGLLEERRQRDLKESQDRIFVKHRDINRLSNEVKAAHITLASELGSFYKIQQNEVTRLIKNFASSTLQAHKEQLHLLTRTQTKLAEFKN